MVADAGVWAALTVAVELADEEAARGVACCSAVSKEAPGLLIFVTLGREGVP